MIEENPCIHLRLKLILKDGQTRDSIKNILEDCDYSLLHDDIVGHEVVDIVRTPFYRSNRVDPFDMIND